MISVDKACEIATNFHNEPFVDVITDIKKGYVIGTIAKDGESSDRPPVYVSKVDGKAESFFIPNHFEEVKNGEMLKVPERYKLQNMQRRF
jgi:hypothetical protein